jgi:hypothetical protein
MARHVIEYIQIKVEYRVHEGMSHTGRAKSLLEFKKKGLVISPWSLDQK